ncbi:MAG: hypothetical protein IH914_00290 [candidate division Zixibacteria bacterium]|nr:hypothetical protein [candidate division Zixibacteria bacterium]
MSIRILHPAEKIVALLCLLLLGSCTTYYASYFVNEAARTESDRLSKGVSFVGNWNDMNFTVYLVNSLSDPNVKHVDSGMFQLIITARRKDDSTKVPYVKKLKNMVVTFVGPSKSIVPKTHFEGLIGNKAFPVWHVIFKRFHVLREIDTIILRFTILAENTDGIQNERAFEEKLVRVEYKVKGPPRGLFH